MAAPRTKRGLATADNPVKAHSAALTRPVTTHREPRLPKGWVPLSSDDEDDNDGEEIPISEMDLPRRRSMNQASVVAQRNESELGDGPEDVPPAKKKRRSTEEVARDRSDQADKKLAAERERNSRLRAVATLEDQMFTEENERQAMASNPARSKRVLIKEPRPVITDASSAVVTVDIDEDYNVGDNDNNNNTDSCDSEDDLASVPETTVVRKHKKAKGDDRALIEGRRSTESSVGDMASQAFDSNKRKHLATQSANKKHKQGPPAGLLEAGLVHVPNPTLPRSVTRTAQKVKARPSHDPDSGFQFGGIIDDDNIDSQPATFPSQSKPQKSIAKITRGAPMAKIEPQNASLRGGKRTYTHDDLPAGCIRNWRDHVIPVWREFSGCQENPWNTSDVSLCVDLAEIWKLVFPSNPQNITLGGAIFGVAIQQWYEWRSAIGRSVLSTVNSYMESLDSDADRAEEANWMLGPNLPFTWKQFLIAEPEKRFGLFASPWILCGLAVHFQMVSTVCEELHARNLEPRGALAISIVAAERAFSFWTTGVNTIEEPENKSAAKFSDDNWGRNTAQYFPSIRNLTPRRWAKLKEAALDLLPPKSRNTIPLSFEQDARSSSPPPDRRGYLFEVDSDLETAGEGL